MLLAFETKINFFNKNRMSLFLRFGPPSRLIQVRLCFSYIGVYFFYISCETEDCFNTNFFLLVQIDASCDCQSAFELNLN
jgi:hypothetical protein